MLSLFEENEIEEILLTKGKLFFVKNFLEKEKADYFFEKLQQNIDWSQGEIKIFGKTHAEPRLTAWYGDEGKSYRYSGKNNEPLTWNDDLLALKNVLETYPPVSDVFSAGFNSVLLNFYRNGQDSMGWHADDEPELGKNPVIASLNLGATRRFLIRSKNDKSTRFSLDLSHGSLLLMAGEMQHHWQHAVPKTAKMVLPRINLTFRHIF